ncbi:MAG TPA: type II secretion system F family protein [Nitrosopumilaceae archaeon]|nr:type II secretion system F family protein [Nitrosopumilaceae archaeon]
MFSFKKQIKKEIKPKKTSESLSNTNQKNSQIISPAIVRQAKKRPKPSKEKEEVSGIYAMSYKLLGKKVKFLYPRLIGLETKLDKGMMPVPYEAYVCTMVFVGMIACIVSFAVSAIFVSIIDLPVTELKVFFPFFAAAAGFEAGLGVMYKYPEINVGTRKRRLQEEAPYFIGYMATLAASGLTLEGIFKAIAKENTKEEFVRSARYIVRNVDILGMDIITALTDLIRKTPAEAFSELLEGLISTIQTGGNLKEYFTALAKVQMEEKKQVIQKMTASLGIIAEMYTILLVVFPLMAIIMFSIMATMATSFLGLDITTMMMLIAYLLVPICGIMILLLIDGMVPKR